MMGSDFEVMAKFAGRTGRIDRIRWMGNHDLSPEEMFDREQGSMMEEVDTLCEVAIQRMKIVCEGLGYEPTIREKNLLTFEYLSALYLEKVLESIGREIDAEDAADAGLGKQPIIEVIREML